MKAIEILNKTRVEVSAETYALISLQQADFQELLENPELSPRMTTPFMIFKDKFEVTLLLDEIDFGKIRDHLQKAKVEKDFRCLTFNVELDFHVFGFLAEITRVLAGAKIPIVALSAFSRDHLLVKQNDLAKALKVLGEIVEDLC